MGDEVIKSIKKFGKKIDEGLLPIDIVSIICMILGTFLIVQNRNEFGGLMISSVVFYYFGKRAERQNPSK